MPQLTRKDFLTTFERIAESKITFIVFVIVVAFVAINLIRVCYIFKKL